MSSGRKKAVVIGAGLGGMSTALRLAAKGWRVSICERSATPGGKMNRWCTQGFTFDTGPSLITMPDVFQELYQSIGTDLRDHIELMSLTRQVHYTFADGMQCAQSASLPEWLDTVRALEGRTDGFMQYMELGARLYNISKKTFFARSPIEPPGKEVRDILPSMPLLRGWGNYHREMCHFIKNPYLRMIFDRYMTYVGSSPYHVPGTLCVVPYIEYARGAWHVRGGLYEIIRSFLRLFEPFGIELHLNAPVTEIERSGRKVTGVRLDNGECIAADAVVMNGDVSRIGALLGHEGFRAYPPGERSLSGLIFLFALKNSHPDWHHHQVFFSNNYKHEFGQLFNERVFPDDPTVYVNMPGITDRGLTPDKGEVMFVMANAPANEEIKWDADFTATARQRVLNRLKASGFPDFEDEIAACDVWTPSRIERTYDMPGGAIYGRNSHGKKNAFMRPFNKDLKFKGLYYVGGSTHPGGGTPTVLMSARITANLIEKYEG
jgi:phytoene desaturase